MLSHFTGNQLARNGLRHTSPMADGVGIPERQPRHCSRCGRGLTQRTRAYHTPEERLLLAIFNVSAVCDRCAPAAVASTLNRRSN